jgi:trehalose synthase-fused probable maltokinase
MSEREQQVQEPFGARLGLADLDPAPLIDYIRQRRWFASRGLEIAGAELVDAVSLPADDPQWLALVTLRFETGTHELYQLLLRTAPHGADGDEITSVDGVVLYESSASPDLARLLVTAPPSGMSLAGHDGTVELRGIGPRYDAHDGPIHALGADQSNTSLVAGNSLLVKMYRRLEAGLNPELEMLLFLTERDFPHVPHAAGWYAYFGEQLRATLGMAQRFLPDAVDGWSLGLSEVPTSTDTYVERVERLGSVIGAMHKLLASDGADDSFAPEYPTPETAALLGATIEEQIDAAFAQLPEFDGGDRIAAHDGELREVVRALMPPAFQGRLIRTHGDLHLGQVLWADDAWWVTDFEGEPDRNIADRRRKMLPLRDVAGMLRSFSYLAAVLEREGRPAPDGFASEARARFLQAYRAELADTDLLPPSEGIQDRLLGLFELEKLLYELRYELSHRPDWAALPAAGLAEFLERATAG